MTTQSSQNAEYNKTMNHASTLQDYFESKRAFWISATVIVCIAILAVTALRNPVDYDGYWHLRMGMDWIANGMSPWLDHYSFTYPGERISNPPFMFQGVLYGFVALFGERGGMVVCKFVATALVFGFLILWLKQLRAPVAVYLLALPVLVVILQFRAQVRPELFSYSLVVIAFVLYHRTRLQLSFSAMAPVVLFLQFWTLYHSSILGYVIFFGLFLDIAIRLIKERATPGDWLSWLGWGLATVAVGFINPAFSHPLIATLLFPEDWKTLILEYKTPGADLNMAAGYLLVVLALAAAIGALVQKRIGYLVILAVFLYSASTMMRMVPPAALVCLVIFSAVLSDTLRPRLASSPMTAWQGATLALSLCTACFSMYLAFIYALAFLKENRGSWVKFPEALVTHYIDTGKKGNIFNEYEMGGFLIYRLSPESKVYIDGRTGILYPVEHFKLHSFVKRDPELFLEQAEKFDIRHSVLMASTDNASLMDIAGFELDYLGVRYSLFTQSSGSLAEFGKLWAHPQCWHQVDQAALERELSPYQEESRQAEPMHSTLKLISGFLLVENKAAFLDYMARNARLDDAGYRFIAYQAHQLKEPTLALFALGLIEHRIPTDDLAVVFVNMLMGEEQEVRNALEKALAYSWRTILPEEERLQHHMIEHVQKSIELGSVAISRRSNLQQDSEFMPDQDMVFNIRSLCTRPNH